MKCISILLFLVISILSSQAAWAKSSAVQKPSTQEIVELMNLYYSNREKPNSDLETNFQTFVVRAIEAENTRIDQLEKVLWWSNLSSNITFIVAHVFLVLGVMVAYRQFQQSTHLRKKGKDQPVDIELKLEGMAMKGVNSAYLILLAALFFYLMYLKFVYPIVVVG